MSAKTAKYITIWIQKVNRVKKVNFISRYSDSSIVKNADSNEVRLKINLICGTVLSNI